MFKIKSLLLGLYLILAGILLANYMGSALAESLHAGVLNIEYAGAPGPLFSDSNIAPGYESVKAITVTNTGKVAHSFSISAQDVSGALADVLQIEPRVSGSSLWNMSLKELSQLSDGSKIILASIPAGESRVVEIAAILPANTGNQYQDASTSSFKFIVGNESTDLSEPVSSTFSSTNSPTEEGIVDADNTENGGLNNSSNTQSNSGEAQGAQTQSPALCYWWWLLLIIYVVFLAVYGYIVRKKETVFAWIWPIFAGLVLYLVHWIMHDYYEPVKWCRYFIYYELLILLLYYYIQWVFPKKS